MVSGAIVGATGGGNPGPPRSLWIDGLDVLREPGTAGNRYSVPSDSITVTEAGMNGVSSMTWKVNDPLAQLTFADGALVVYHNHNTNLPDFRGWLLGPIEVTVHDVGRTYNLRAVGPEALLDWLVLGSDVTFANPTPWITAVQTLVPLCSMGGASPLRVFDANDTPGTGSNSTQAFPTSQLQGPPLPRVQVAVTLTAGTTLRECLRQVADVIDTAGGITGGKVGGAGPFYTVDMWFGLRSWGFGASLFDGATLTMNDVTPGPILAARLTDTRDTTGVPRAVFVKGGNAAGSGMVTDGSGKPGPTAVLNDSTITTATARDFAAGAYLGSRVSTRRGTVRRDDFVSTDTVTSHTFVGCSISITDAQLPNSPASGTIMGIVKTYLGGMREVWDITYGGLPPSFPRELRRLTRGTLS